MGDDLVIEVKWDRLLVQRDNPEVEVAPGGIRYLANALAEAASRFVGQKAHEG